MFGLLGLYGNDRSDIVNKHPTELLVVVGLAMLLCLAILGFGAANAFAAGNTGIGVFFVGGLAICLPLGVAWVLSLFGKAA